VQSNSFVFGSSKCARVMSDDRPPTSDQPRSLVAHVTGDVTDQLRF